MFIKENSLIVSCQAVEGEPLYNLGIMHHFARAAVMGGADGIRANYVADINDIKAIVSVPTIGIIKAIYPDSSIYITPTKKEVMALLEETQTEVIAMDATLRRRPNDEKLSDLVELIRNYPRKVEIMADCATLDEAIYADRLGFDYIGTTLRGYTDNTKLIIPPDYAFIDEIIQNVSAKVIAEGGIWEVGQLEKVLERKVYAVVIGSSITRPMDITKRFKKCFL